MTRWMDGLMEGWMKVGWMDDGWKDGEMDRWMEACRHGEINRWMDGWSEGWMDDEQIDGWMDG